MRLTVCLIISKIYVFSIENIPIFTTLTSKGHQIVLCSPACRIGEFRYGKDTTVCVVSQALLLSVISVGNSLQACKLSNTAATIRLVWPCYTTTGWKYGRMPAPWP